MFAVDDPKMDGHDSRLWVFKCALKFYGDIPDETESNYNHLNPFEIREPIIVNPAYYYTNDRKKFIGSERRWLQMGRFLVQSSDESITPMEENPAFTNELVKIIIPSALKPTIRRFYEDTGLDKKYLYGEKDSEIDNIVADLKRYKEIY